MNVGRPSLTLFPYTTLFRSNLYQPRACTVRAGPYSSRGASAAEHAKPWLRQVRSEEHTSELQSRGHLVCRLLLEKKKKPLLGVSSFSVGPPLHMATRLSATS